jgi:hypothetical protein
VDLVDLSKRLLVQMDYLQFFSTFDQQVRTLPKIMKIGEKNLEEN